MQQVKLNPKFDDLSKPETILNHVKELTNEQSTYESLEVKATDEIKPPKTAIQQIVDNAEIILGTLGNFSLAIGKAKSRKSFFISIMIAATLAKDFILGQFKGVLPEDKKTVLYFDTEQGRYHVQLALKRICKLVGVQIPENLKVYCLRSKKPSERLKIIEQVIYDTPNLGFVVIDGIKDLVTSINDEAEATEIASKLLKWTEELDIHIMVVLHQNKSDNNARGYIGTELINKAETVLSVTKDENNKDISIVEAQFCRNREPLPFAFEIDETGLPIEVDDYELKTESKKNRFDILELEDEKKYSILREVYDNGNEFTYSDLVTQMKIACKKLFKNKIGDNRLKELLTDCKNKGWLSQEKPKAPYSLKDFMKYED